MEIYQKINFNVVVSRLDTESDYRDLMMNRISLKVMARNYKIGKNSIKTPKLKNIINACIGHYDVIFSYIENSYTTL